MRQKPSKEFDNFASEYDEMHEKSISLSGEQPYFFHRYKIVDVKKEQHKSKISVNKILDFGCGIGNSLPFWYELFPEADIYCVDPSPESIAVAQSRSDVEKKNTKFFCLDSKQLPFCAGYFDVVFAACVFHHIPHNEHVNWLKEMGRVTRSGGMAMIFEHNPLNPFTIKAVADCPFDVDANLIGSEDLKSHIHTAGWLESKVVYRIFFPRMFKAFRPIENYMKKLPLGAQFYVTARQP